MTNLPPRLGSAPTNPTPAAFDPPTATAFAPPVIAEAPSALLAHPEVAPSATVPFSAPSLPTVGPPAFEQEPVLVAPAHSAPAEVPAVVTAVAPALVPDAVNPVAPNSAPVAARAPDDAAPRSDQHPLRVIKPVRFLALGLLGASLPMQFLDAVSDIDGIVTGAAGFVALVVWSMIAVSNADRARPATTHARAPRPLSVLCAWLFAPLLAAPGVLGLMHLRDAVDSASEVDKDAATIALSGAVFAFVVIGLIVVYFPYAKLGAAAKWISADATKFRRWFFAPLVTALLTLIGLVLYGMSGNEEVAEGPGLDAVFAGLSREGFGLILLVILPAVAWFVMALRAMIDIEEATVHQHRRRANEELPNEAVNAYLTSQGVPMPSSDTD